MDARPQEGYWFAQVLIFSVGAEVCALPADDVAEIVPLPALSTPPGLPRLVEGFVNRSGVVYPVLRADRLLGLDGPTPDLYSPVILLRGASSRLALVVEAARGLLRPPAEKTLAVQGDHTLNDCVAAIIQAEAGPIPLLRADRLLSQAECRRLETLRAMEEERLRELEEA